MKDNLSLSHDEGVRKVASLIKGIKFAMLATTNYEGHIHTRPMTTQQATFDGTLWFFTTRNAPFRQDVDAHPEVNLAYVDIPGNAYVSVCGQAAFIDDHAKAEELWNPSLKAWFPEGVNDPNLIMLKVDVHSAHYWDAPSSSMVQLMGMVKASLTGERYNAGEKGKVSLQH